MLIERVISNSSGDTAPQRIPQRIFRRDCSPRAVSSTRKLCSDQASSRFEGLPAVIHAQRSQR